MIQSLLVALDRFAVVRAGGRLLYRVDGQLLGQLCRRVPEIRAMYLAGSMASGDIAPGLSDIDIVLLIDDLPAEREFRLIGKIEARLRYTMPPFGRDKAGDHLMIYSVSEWRSVGALLLGKQSGAPLAVFEKGDEARCYPIDGEVHSLHHLLKALWRIEGFDIRDENGSNTRLEMLLRLRMADRLVGAMEHAVDEAGAAQLADSKQFFESAKQLRAAIAEMRARKDDAGLNALLPDFLACLEQAVACSADRGANPWAEPVSDTSDIDSSPSRALAAELRPILAPAPGGDAVFVTRLRKSDFLVCNPPSPRTLQALRDRYRGNPDHAVRIVTPRVFESLYLGTAFGPALFIRLNDLEAFEVCGRTGPERLELDAYALYPKIRALKKLADPAIFASYAESLNRLLALAGSSQAASTSEPDSVAAGFTTLRENTRELARLMERRAIARAGPGA